MNHLPEMPHKEAVTLPAGNIAKSDDTVSISERRKLAQFPKINVENMKDGTFMSGFESYAKDQFPLREQFRALKTAFSMYVLGQKDQHGLYIKDGYFAKMEYPKGNDHRLPQNA